MKELNVNFLGNEYALPADVLVYLDLLSFTEAIKESLLNSFKQKVWNSETGCIDDKDMAEQINQQVGKFVSLLCDKGIYNRTINDYLRNNKGYELFSQTNKAALENAKAILMNKIDTLKSGVEDALYKKDASVTGMGFSIWSGSFVNHAIYAAMQASTIRDQEKAANAQYQRDIDKLYEKMDSDESKAKTEYLYNVYIPNMEIALTVFAYELLDKYVSDLIENNLFDKRTLEYIDIARSNELLDNLNLSNNKKVIINNAFIACPYNIAVYMQAMKFDLLDYESFQTAKLFKQDGIIISFLQDNLGYSEKNEKQTINLQTATLLSLFTNTPIRTITTYMADFIVDEYKKVLAILSDRAKCHSIIDSASESEILSGEKTTKEKAEWLIDSIVTRHLWERLTNECGHNELLDRLLEILPQKVEITSKQEYDTHIKEKLFSVLEPIRQEKVQEINARKAEEKRRREIEAENAKIRAERNKKIKKICFFIGLIFLGIFILSTAINKVINLAAYKQIAGEYCVYESVDNDGSSIYENNWWLSIGKNGSIELTSYSYVFEDTKVDSYTGTLKNKTNFSKFEKIDIEDYDIDLSKYNEADFCYKFHIADEYDEYDGYLVCWQYKNGNAVDIYYGANRFSFVETDAQYGFDEWLEKINSNSIDDDVKKLIAGIDTVVFDNASIENINYATAFLGKRTDESGNINVSENDYAFLNNDASLLDISGRFSHAFSPTGTDNKTIDMMDWVSKKETQNFEDIISALKNLYGDDCRIQHYNDAGGDAYMWKNVDLYEYVICWQNTDGTVNIRWTIQITDFANCDEGDIVQFGRYEQDGNADNGKENIDWLVLEIKDGKALIISKYALDTQSYNKHSENVTWETCSLRAWLNNNFIDSAFSSTERDMILNTDVSPNKNPVYEDKVDSGQPTSDKVFLLSIDEAKAYLPTWDERKCEPTSYVSSETVFVWDGYIDWWLRTPGEEQNKASYISANDDIVFSGDLVFSTHIAVRPVMWIEIGS